MFRVKDFTRMISHRNKNLELLIYDTSQKEVDYLKAWEYMNKYVASIQFKKRQNKGDFPYVCIITTSNENGDPTTIRNLIKFSEILEVCSFKNVNAIPVDDKDNKTIWDGKSSLYDHYESESVINVIPFFGINSMMIHVILTDNLDNLYDTTI